MDTATRPTSSHLRRPRCDAGDPRADVPACTISLPPGDLLAIDVPPDAELLVQVVEGRIWATDGASGRDHFVRAPREWRAGPGRALISALDATAALRWRIER